MATSKSPTARELFELKQQAIKYYEENGVPQKFEEILNSMFYESPVDVYGHLVNYFEQFAKPPVISKLSAKEIFDSKGQITLLTDVHCTICNEEKVVCSETVGTFCQVPEHASQEDKDAEEKMRLDDILAAVDLIQGPITDTLNGVEPTNQENVDRLVYDLVEKLRVETEEKAKEAEAEDNDPEEASPTPGRAPATESPKGKVKSAGKNKGGKAPAVSVVPDEPLEKFYPGSNAVASVSAAVCQAGSLSCKKSLYRHVAHLMHEKEPDEYCLPLPMVTILSSGRAAAGKSKCVKDYMVVPKPGMPMKESLKHIAGISNALGKSCSRAGGSAKGKKGNEGGSGPKMTSELGVVMPLIERPEQGIEMIQDAMNVLGLTPGEDFHIALNCSAHEIFDFEKGKYEPVVGVQKDPEGMIDFWADIVTRYPSVIALIDPLRKQDSESWMQLCERISEQCYVMGDSVYHRPGLLKNEEISPAFKTSAIILRVEQMNTVSDVMTVAKKMQAVGNEIVIGTSSGETNSHLVTDLACGMNARFLMVGGMTRGERVAKLNRLLQIESELMEKEGCLRVMGDHTFPLIKPPTPPPEETENGEGATEQ